MGPRRFMPLFKIKLGFTPKKAGFPQHEVGQFAHLDRTHQVRYAMAYRGIDGVLGDIALDPGIVVRSLSPSRGRASPAFCARSATFE